ncbi:MAG: winged helix-turn-helix domain-containing protein [Enterocloster sp.]|uniref:winged helix-turn-helix domain-containing protein n=1 Tax=Enterocloster sp. TaxID=2719315 RepID=UPI00399C4266
MKKKIIIYLEDLTASQEVLLQKLLQSFCVEQIEVLEDTTSTLLVGDLQIDVERRQVWRAGNLIELTSMEFDILYLLARRPGQVFSARQIYEAVAADSFDASWTGISSMVYKLRRKLGCRYHRNSAGPRLQIRCPRHLTKIK